jgi:hemerythrin-like domain-containing protein
MIIRDSHPARLSRRRFAQSVVAGGAACCVSLIGGEHVSGQTREVEEEEVTPAEDLMREHGVLKRVLLVYDEAIRRIDAHLDLPPEPIRDGASIIRTFIEDYHEKLEEDYLFPRFEKADRLTDLTRILRAQHQAGRRVTEQITQLATAQTLKQPQSAVRLRDLLHQFVRMYAPHEAREDTVLFPALRNVISAHEYGALGEDFEKKEHELFGDEGFERFVDRVAGIEKQLGIYDLAQFTPAV